MRRVGMVLIVSLTTTTTAFAYLWDAANAPAGNSLTWHMCANFSTAEETDIETAADAWDAGTGERLRGALWSFVRGSDLSSGCVADNNRNEVYERDLWWFLGAGYAADTPAVCLCSLGYDDYDIVFNSSRTYSTGLPSETTSTTPSIGQIALHEFGHALGLDHEDDYIATMNSSYPNGGDIGHRIQPNENDYAGLAANRSHTSTGKNLTLNRFHEGSSGTSEERWNDVSVGDWSACQVLLVDPGGPDEVFAIIEGTSGQSPEIEWRLSADTNCFSGTEYVVGSRTPTLSVYTAYLVHPQPYDFRYTPPGDYYLCAMIDPDDIITETDETDNQVRWEVLFTVEDCP